MTLPKLAPPDPNKPQLDVSHRTVSATMLAFSTRSFAKAKLSQDARVSLLEYLRVRDSGIGHVSVYSALANPSRARACTACNCLVVTESFNMTSRGIFSTSAEREVVAAALACSAGAESK